METNSLARILTLILIPSVGFLIGLQLMRHFYTAVIFESSLVSTQTEFSEYLRPKSWSHAAQGSLKFYADWPQDMEIPRAKMMIVDSGSPMIRLPFGDPSVESWRDVAYEEAQGNLATLQSSSDTTCNDFSNTQIMRGTAARGSVSDVLTITADCRNGDKEYIYYWRTTVDSARKVRLVAFISEKWLWEKNDKIFIKMIDSVQPITSAGKV